MENTIMASGKECFVFKKLDGGEAIQLKGVELEPYKRIQINNWGKGKPLTENIRLLRDRIIDEDLKDL